MANLMRWRTLKGGAKKRLRCMKCDNPMLNVIWEPVARQARSMTAHHVRVIAKCPMCKSVRRIKLGAPN